MKLRFLAFALVVGCFVSAASIPMDYSGENLLRVLGSNTNSREFKEFKQYWWLDKNFENQQNGIKIYVNQVNATAEEILLAGDGFLLNGTKFNKCIYSLPFGIAWTDDTATLHRKLGNGSKLIGRNAMKYHRDYIGIEITYTNLKNGSIESLKFYTEEKPFVPMVEEPQPVKKNSKIEAKRQETRAQVHEVKEAIIKEEEVCSPANCSPFKKSILDVFTAYRQSGFQGIKVAEHQRGNYWNYKYTYATNVKIPGERFNMLYSFPFSDSQLDFVSVIKEADNYDKSFESVYREFERKLIDNFPESEGWSCARTANFGNQVLADLEIRNSKYGSVILDYCKNPQGRHVLFLRFLLFSE